MDKPEYILCVAIHFKDGKRHEHTPKNVGIGFVMCGRRHHNILTMLYELTPSEKRRNSLSKRSEHTQGFITSLDRFVDRNQAATIAFKAGQTKVDHATLMSEHLY